MLLAIDFHEDFIDVEGVTIASVLTLQTVSINGAKLDAPETNRLAGHSDASLGEQIFDIPVAEIESIVEPDSVTDDIGWESVPFVCSHGPILAIMAA